MVHGLRFQLRSNALSLSTYVCLCVRVSVLLCLCLSVRLSVCLSICLDVFLSVCPSVCLSTWLSGSLAVWLSVCMSACLHVCLPACLPACLPITYAGMSACVCCKYVRPMIQNPIQQSFKFLHGKQTPDSKPRIRNSQIPKSTFKIPTLDPKPEAIKPKP